MKTSLSSVVVFRVPRFPWDSSMVDHWDELKAAIAISSPEFYDYIENVIAADINKLPEKIQFTLWKYFNRACFRATPFGMFGAFGITELATQMLPSPIVISDTPTAHRFINWPQTNELRFDFPTLIREGKIKLFSNTSYYETKGFLRFVSKTEQRTFELQEIQGQEILSFILETCKIPTSVKDLIHLADLGAEMEEDLLILINEMVENQLLMTELYPNIIGPDYFERIGVKELEESTPYIISEVDVLDGVLDAHLFKHVPELVTRLHQLSMPRTSSSLDRFLTAFSRKFEQKEVPIMVALDPEIGVGYDELEQSTTDDEFIAQLRGRTMSEDKSDTNALEDFFAKQLTSSDFSNEQIIQLDRLNTENLKEFYPLPNTFSLIARTDGERVMLENIGGITANTLMGRFTLASDKVWAAAKNMAAIEIEANPEIVFFDVAYIAETQVDNINRRRNIYDMQLSILNYDTSANPLTLADMLISVKGKDVILRSMYTGKRLVPRIATAYNHSRSDLSVFRFFCDLQNQGLQTSLSFSLEDMFPGRPFYPEVQFKNLVLSPRMWRINEDEIKTIANDNSLSEIQTLFAKKGIKERFKAGFSDQTLCFNPAELADLQAFKQYITTQKSCLLKAANLPGSSNLKNKNGECYVGEFVLNVVNNQQIYSTILSNSVVETDDLVQFFAPGSEWVYFEIYCHPRRADNLLLNAISALVNQFEKDIEHWFFIRYTENGNHIRLRLRLKDISANQQIVTGFNTILMEDLYAGWVSDLQIKTYRRETARYGAKRMERVEAHFCVDSRYVLQVLSLQLSSLDKYMLCVKILFEIQDAVFEAKEFSEILKQMSGSFTDEHSISSADFKQLNIRFQEFSKHVSPNILDIKLQSKFTKSFIYLVADAEENEKITLLTNLFHMHVNRLFSDAQRTHEMLVYYFAYKQSLRLHAIKSIKYPL